MSVSTIDTSLYDDVNRLAVDTPWAHTLVADYANYGIAVFAVLVVLAWWWSRRAGDPRAAVALVVAVAVAVLVAVALNQPLGDWVARPRPFVTMPRAEVLFAHSADFSFPSDHTVAAGAVVTGLWLLRRLLLAVVGTLAALAIAFARVYAGVHYPGDVLAGLAVGTVVTLLVAPLLARLCKPAVAWLAGSPLGFLVLADGVRAGVRGGSDDGAASGGAHRAEVSSR